MILNAITWNVNPEIFPNTSIPVRYYGLMFAFAFLFSYSIMSKIFKREKISIEMLDKLTLYVAIGTIAGARLGHCLFYEPADFLPKPWTIFLPFRGMPFSKDFEFTGYQGLASHGGAIGIVIGIYLFCRKYKFKFLHILDRIALVSALGGFFVRMGNLFNSEIYGVQTSLPWGFIFLRNDEEVPKHPTQLYEAFSYLIIFFVLYAIYKKNWKKLQDGFILGWLMITMFTARFLIEFVKNDQVDFEANIPLNMGQWLSVPFIAIGIFMLRHGKKQALEKR